MPTTLPVACTIIPTTILITMPEWVAGATGVVGVISGIAALWENHRRRKREAEADARNEEEAKTEEQIKIILSTLNTEEAREQIVSIIISSEHMRAYLREEGKAVFLEELVDSPSMVALREAITDMQSNMRRIEDIFIQAGATKLTQRTSPGEARFTIKKNGQGD